MHVLVIGASGGIGAALAVHHAAAGADVTTVSRSSDGFDITDEGAIARHLADIGRPCDRIFIATGALELNGTPPEKTIKALDPQVLAAQFALNATGPALVLKHALPLIPRGAPCKVAVLSARVGSIGDNGLGGWYAYRAAKAALNQLVHTAAIEIARSHPQAVIACLHPGTVATPLTAKYVGSHPTVPPARAAANLSAVLESLTPDKTGGFFDWQGRPIPW